EWRGALLAPLPTPVAAQVAGFLPARDTARLGQVVSGGCAVLEHAAAWEPLVLGRRESGALLRRLRVLDPLVTRRADGYPPLLRAMGRVSTLRWELMDSDQAPAREDGDDADDGSALAAGAPASAAGAVPEKSEDEARRRLRTGLVFDPLDELCRRLRRGWFSSVVRMEISNIEDHRMDFNFLQLRSSVFGRFPHLRLSMSSGCYDLLASTEQLEPTASVVDARTALQESAARHPPGAALLLGAASEFSDFDVHFVREHLGVFKSGDRELPLCARPVALAERRTRAEALRGPLARLPCSTLPPPPVTAQRRPEFAHILF
ncbi:unnamed protein product, partial [Prorocentrum cordatum]